MGNCCCKSCPACPIMQYDCCIDRRRSLNSDFHLPAAKKATGGGGNPFNPRGNVFSATNDTAGLVDINSATEETLMTLPCISRPIAKSIVEHRRAIGGFKKIEDLALVSGMGATRLARIRTEIYIGEIRIEAATNGSVNSVVWKDDSVYNSRSDLDGVSENSCAPSSDSGVKNWYRDVRININSATKNQLTKIKNLKENLAENIIQYRNTHGLFTSIDDLRKVKGMNKQLVDSIRPKLALTQMESTPVKIGARKSPGKVLNKEPHNSSTSTDLLKCSLLDDEQKELISLYGPLLEKSARKCEPEAPSPECYVIRIATWHLDRFDEDKSSNPGVQEVIAMTILENRFSLLAVQDIYSELVLKNVCDSINEASIPSVQRWKELRGTWKYHILPSPAQDSQSWPAVGFLYNESEGLEIKSSTDLDLCSPFIRSQAVVFLVEGVSELTLVNIQQIHERGAEVVNKRDICNLVTYINSDSKRGFQDPIILGYFGAPCTANVLSPLMDEGYKALVEPNVLTDVDLRNPDGTSSTQNVYQSQNVCSFKHAGRCGVIRNGLTSPWIPSGWQWGGYVSSHCPVWADFYKTDNAEVPSGECKVINSDSTAPLLNNAA